MANQIKQLAPQIWSEIKKTNKILLVIHNSPDFDSIGSNLGFMLALEKIGKKVTLISGDDPLPSTANYLPGSEKIINKKFSDLDFKDFDLYLAIDCPVLGKISRNPEPELPLPFFTIVIDHHKDNPKYGNINLIDPTLSSAAEVSYLLLKEFPITLNKDIATCLLMGELSDNGTFRFANDSTPFLIASDLANLGANPREIIHQISSCSNKELQVLGQALYTMKVYFQNKVQIAILGLEDIQETKSIHKLVGFQLSLSQDSIISVTIHQKDTNKWGVSLRANNPIDFRDVSVIAKALNGGGHKGAASGEARGTKEEVTKIVLEAIQKTYPDLGQP